MRHDLPLVRLPPWFPGQMGVPGTDTRTGLRTHPTGAVFYVDPNYPGASDQRDGTNPDDPLRTVGAALTKCQAYRGDTIVVGANGGWQFSGPSDYPTVIQEAVVVTVPGVRILGAHPSSPVGVVWTPPAAGGPCISVHALDVLIAGFAFVGGIVGGTAISVDWDGVTTFGDNVAVEDCYFDDDIDVGVALEFVWHGAVRRCVFDACDDFGIYVDPAGSGIADCQIVGNWFKDCADSNISLRGAVSCLVAGNFVFSSNAQSGALATDELIDTAVVAFVGGQNIVAHNVLSCILDVAPANGDYDDACSSAATDAWVENYLMNGPSLRNPS